MRLRIPELLKAADLTAYGLHKASDERISLSTAFRLVREEGRLKMFDGSILEALCDTLSVEPGDLFERDKPKTVRKRS